MHCYSRPASSPAVYSVFVLYLCSLLSPLCMCCISPPARLVCCIYGPSSPHLVYVLDLGTGAVDVVGQPLQVVPERRPEGHRVAGKGGGAGPATGRPRPRRRRQHRLESQRVGESRLQLVSGGGQQTVHGGL